MNYVEANSTGRLTGSIHVDYQQFMNSTSHREGEGRRVKLPIQVFSSGASFGFRSGVGLGIKMLIAILILGVSVSNVDAAGFYVQDTTKSTSKNDQENDDASESKTSLNDENPEADASSQSDKTQGDENEDSPKESGDKLKSAVDERDGKTNIKTPDDPSLLESTVGFPKIIYQKVIEGPKLIAKPMRDKGQPVVIRIVKTYPHFDHFRYDIEYRGLEPGNYNISDYLTREDGSDVAIEPVNVKVNSILGPGQVVPYQLPPTKSRYSSFYLPIMLALGTLWVAGLLMILFYGRGKKKRPSNEAKKVTVAERIQPLLDAAAAGELNSQQQAELERVLSSFWSKKLRLEHLPADQLRQQLRGHSEASVLLDQIDTWIHKPGGNGSAQVDVNRILEPYRTMNYEDVS